MSSLLFPDSFHACRGAFLETATAAGAQIDVVPAGAQGPAGEALEIAVASLGPVDAPHVIGLQCGIHGVEGPSGSAVMVEVLRAGALAAAARQHRVVLVHSANPFGFAWQRRQTSGNIDLNRNFLDWTQPPPQRPVYARVDPLLNPAGSEEPDDAAFLAAAAELVALHGLPWVQARVSEGQYSFPQGLYYGGAAADGANLALRRIWRDALAQAQTATVIDFHTGLGSYGDWIALSASPAGTSAHARLQILLGADRVVATSGSGNARDNRYPDTSGKFAHGLMADAPHCAIAACSLEFGTVDELVSIRAERLENWLWHHGDRNSPRGQAIVAAHAACFNPPDPAWQRQVLDGGMEVVRRVAG